MSSRSKRGGSGSPARSTNSRRAPRGEPGSETENSVATSEGIPPKSIRHMRDNLRQMIDMMGDDTNNDCGCNNEDNSESPASAVESLDNRTAPVRADCCRCCGKLAVTSSESGAECCTCEAVQPEVHRTCIGKAGTEEGKTRRQDNRYQCIDRQYRSHGKHDEMRLIKSDSVTSSSEECPCEGPCPGKQNARKKIKNFLNRVVGIKENIQTQHELYKFRLKQQDPNFKLPKRLVFDLVDGIPKAPSPPKEKPKKSLLRSDLEDYNNKVDVYYFDHGNSGYYRTTDDPPPLMADFFIEQTDLYATRFWAEIFGTIHIGVAFVTTFLLQLLRFALYSVLRPLTVGLIQLGSDYLFKPLLSILFNGVVQPILILFYNVATSFRDLCEPLAQGVGFFLREVANVFRAVRLVEVNKMKTVGMPCGGGYV